jgi:hypothetical protein
MSAELALAYDDSVNQQVCAEFSDDFQAWTETAQGVPYEVERELAVFVSELRDAAAETRQLIAEIEALTS